MTDEQKIKQAMHFLEMHYDAKFPNGYSKVSYFNSTLSNTHYFTVGLIDNKADCSSNIRDNDIGFGKFKLNIQDGKLVLEKTFHALTCNPTEKYNALSHQTVAYRKIKAKDYNDLVNKFAKYLTKFATLLSEKVAENNIYNQSKYDDRYFQYN